MSNYTTQTASLKATTIDSRKINAKQIDTKKLFINGELFDPSQESPNEAMFQLTIVPYLDAEEKGVYTFLSSKLNQDGECMVQMEAYLQKGSQTEGSLPNGVYAVIQIDDNFAKCFCENGLNASDVELIFTTPSAKFMFANLQNSIKIEQCILENFLTLDDFGETIWAIKICEEDDNLSELYGGITEDLPYFVFAIKIPYYIPENDTSSSTYSLRKTNPIDSLREKFEQMRQQNLDNPTE